LRVTTHLPRSPTLPYTTLFRSSKPSQDNPQGGIISQEAAIHVSNVMVVDPKTNEPTRVGYKRVNIKTKSGEEKEISVRVAKKSRSEEHTSELQSRENLVCRLLL